MENPAHFCVEINTARSGCGGIGTLNVQIRQACASGVAAILIPDTIEEALEIADNIIVMRDGEVTARHDLRQNTDLTLHDIVVGMV